MNELGILGDTIVMSTSELWLSLFMAAVFGGCVAILGVALCWGNR